MEEAWITFLLSLLQIAGAVYAFSDDGVLAKLLGLLFCLAAAACFLASLIFRNDYKQNKRKGNHS